MARESTDGLEPPFTHIVGVEKALATLDYREMVDLAALLGGWAFNEPELDGDQRTRLVQMSADYERIAEFCGEGWEAGGKGGPVELMAFIARNAFPHE